MIDLQAVQGAYKSHETSNVSFIRGPNNPADGMTKPFECTPSHDLLRTGKANFTVEQLVIRSTNTTVRSGLASGSSNANDDSTRHLPSYHEQVAGDQIQSNCNTECTACYSFIASHPELSRELLQHCHAYNSMKDNITFEIVSRHESSIWRSPGHQQFTSYKPGELAKRSCGSVKTAYLNQAV